ncbi:MAG: hypothetical protein HYU67_01885 [Flavobacteriia bacterium]|nr:hypothetical protein [Flavobacteriia bacterium]
MKHLLFILVFFISLLSLSQSKYELAMLKGLDDAKKTSKPSEYIPISAYFERIANAEKDKWLPYYYAALYNHLSGWDLQADKDKVSEKTLALIEKAEILEKNNAELFCLRQMMFVMQMSTDPMTRWMTYGQKASNALKEAKVIEPSNPRIYFLEAQTVVNTPEQFGGGKKNAKPLFEKSVELYNKYTLASDLHPNWGKEEAENMLKECQK